LFLERPDTRPEIEGEHGAAGEQEHRKNDTAPGVAPGWRMRPRAGRDQRGLVPPCPIMNP
jgi:hypothetical protein